MTTLALGLRASKQILARQPTNDAQSLLARAEIAALSGKHDNAKSILAGVLDESWPYLQRDYLLLASAILVAITGNDLNTAARILNRICGSGDWFSVGQESTEIPYLLAVRWEIQDREHSIFWLNKRSDCSLQAFQILLYRLAHLLPLLASYRGCKEFTLGTVMLDMGDVPRVPGLACTGYSAKARREHFLIPDWEFMLTSGYVDMRENAKAIPWDQRVPMALWRGSTTGFPLDADRGWQSFPRVALCEIGRAHPDIIDAGITVALRPYAQMPSSELERDLRGANLMRAPMPYTDFTKYKYQIDIDGNSNSFSGPFLKLLTGSPVLKVASLYGYRQWYYERLQPWVNYVPVADDMSDLAEKIEWLRAHDDVARRIGENGHALAISLGYASEIRAAGRTIASAIRYFSWRPETELQFGIEVARDVRLLEGWAAPHEEGLVMLGQSSQLELQRPIASEAFVLTLDVSPFTNDAALPVQRIGVVVNGEVLERSLRSGTKYTDVPHIMANTHGRRPCSYHASPSGCCLPGFGVPPARWSCAEPNPAWPNADPGERVFGNW